jgi:hypothetical protein
MLPQRSWLRVASSEAADREAVIGLISIVPSYPGNEVELTTLDTFTQYQYGYGQGVSEAAWLPNGDRHHSKTVNIAAKFTARSLM